MKKVLSVILSAVILMTLFTVVPLTADAAKSGDFMYIVRSDNTVRITKYTGSDSKVTVPAKISGLPVTQIGKSAFAYSGFSAITLPAGLQYIDMWAFEGCSRLKTIHLPKKVRLSERAFMWDSSLTKITVDAANPYYTSVGGVLFSKDKTTLYVYPLNKGVTTYAVPKGVKTIAPAAFYLMTYDAVMKPLKSVTLPDSLVSIGKWAFGNCRFDSITLPKNVKNIDCVAFYTDAWVTANTTCVLKNIKVVSDNPYFRAVNGVLYSKNMKKLVYAAGRKAVNDLAIPKTVQIIGENAFSGNNYLKKITIPANVKTIEDDAFSGCYYLSEITLSEGLTTIGERAFLSCSHSSSKSGLRSIRIPSTVTKIGEKAVGWFYGEPVANPWKTTGFLIKGYLGTAAQKYAQDNEITFAAYDANLPVPNVPTLKNTKNGVQVVLKKVAGAANYRIFRKVGNGKWAKLADTKKLLYLDTTAKKGVVYSYTVRCITANGKAYTSSYNTVGSKIKCNR